MQTTVAAVLVIAVCAVPVAAQSFNIDIAEPGAGPPPEYAAAGIPGQWNAIPAAHNTTTDQLVDVDGNVTPADVWQFGGTELLLAVDGELEGHDAVLMNDCLVTYTPNLETCLFFHNLEPGEYEVLIYARMPAAPDVLSYTNCDEEPGNPHVIVGGEWSGEHEELVSYSRHVATVTTGLLRVHSGIVPGQNAALGAAFNAVQIRKIEPIVGDLDGDGTVDGSDLGLLLAAWGPCGSCDEDLNGDHEVDGEDLGMLLANWGGGAPAR